MKNLLVKEDDVIEIKIFVGENDKGVLVASANEEVVNTFTQGEKQSFNFVFRRPSFKDAKILAQNISVNTEDISSINLNLHLTKLKKVSYLMIRWDLKDNEGKEISFSPENVDALDPTVANALANELDDVTGGTLT